MCRMTLQQRLRYHVGKRVSIDAVDFSSEPGTLQRVYRKMWIRVEGVYFVSQTLNQIVLYNISTSISGPTIFIRSTYRGSFDATYVRRGYDFLEVIVDEGAAGKRRMLIPLNKVVSMERVVL